MSQCVNPLFHKHVTISKMSVVDIPQQLINITVHAPEGLWLLPSFSVASSLTSTVTPVIPTSHSSKQGVQPLRLHSSINHSIGLLFNIPTSSQGRKSKMKTPFRNTSLPQNSSVKNL